MKDGLSDLKKLDKGAFDNAKFLAKKRGSTNRPRPGSSSEVRRILTAGAVRFPKNV